jgi:hypothetical protein
MSRSRVRLLIQYGSTWCGTVAVLVHPSMAQVGPHWARSARRSRRVRLRRLWLAPTALP